MRNNELCCCQDETECCDLFDKPEVDDCSCSCHNNPPTCPSRIAYLGYLEKIDG